MIEVRLKKGKNVIDPDRGLRKFKKALMKEGTLRELKTVHTSYRKVVSVIFNAVIVITSIRKLARIKED